MSRQNCMTPSLLVAVLSFAGPGRLLAQDEKPGPEAKDDRPVLELSLDSAVELALKSNADLTVQKFNPQSSQEDIRSAKGAYDLIVNAQVHKTSQDSPATSEFSPNVNTTTWNWNLGTSQLLKTGGTWTIAFDSQEQNTNNPFTVFNPSYGSTFTLGLTQPLLKNFKTDPQRTQLIITKNNREVSDIAFRETVVNTIATVKKDYYDVVFSIDNLAAARKSLNLAKKLLSENQIKVRVGTLAPLDVVEAESEVASREGDVITAENVRLNAEDVLKAAIFPKNEPEMWGKQVVPANRPTADARPVDVEAAIKNALEKRTDIVAARKNLETQDAALRLAKSEVLPELDFVGSYSGTGQGGTLLIRGESSNILIPGPVVSTVPGGYGDALSQVFKVTYPGWVAGVNLTVPIMNRQARAAAAKARISKEQLEAALTRLELQIATQVRNAGRAVESNFKLTEATKAAYVLADRRLDAEEKKFAAGMSTNFLVTQAQRDLAVAEVNELQAIANYRKSVIEFDRVQDAGNGTGLATGALQ